MSRPREFDDQTVIEQVADVFTSHGYNGTSMSMLVEATGMGKQSLYNAFGDKEQLYLQAIDCAASRFGKRLNKMTSAKTGFEAISIFFTVLVGACSSADAAENNCIISSGLLEGIEAPLISEKLQRTWNNNHEFLREQLARGQQDGSIRKDQSPKDLADIAMVLMSGLRVSARALNQTSQIKNAAQHCLELLKPRQGN
jgi:TetR/AcrR family transcriptional regulator, transcriptional repressor for nem operon